MSYVKGYRIESPGDPSAGWFPSTWIIQGGFYFDGDEDRKVFEDQLLSAFRENVADDAYIITEEELEAMNNFYTHQDDEG